MRFFLAVDFFLLLLMFQVLFEETIILFLDFDGVCQVFFYLPEILFSVWVWDVYLNLTL